MAGMGRPKVSAEVRTRIKRLGASNPLRPPTIDKVLEILEKEGIEVSRSYVGGVVNKWEAMPLEMRQRDMPFEWRQLERARVPWGAPHWLIDY